MVDWPPAPADDSARATVRPLIATEATASVAASNSTANRIPEHVWILSAAATARRERISHSSTVVVSAAEPSKTMSSGKTFKASSTPSLALLLNPLAWFIWILDFAIWVLTFGWVKTIKFYLQPSYL